MKNDCCSDLYKLQKQFKILLQSAANSNLELSRRNTKARIKPLRRLGERIKRKSYANRELNRLITNAQLAGGMKKGDKYIGPGYKKK